MDVKTLQRETSCLEFVTIFKAVHRNKISNTICFFLRKNLAADVCQQIENFLVAPYAERVSKLKCHPHDPDTAQQMVRVSMGDEEVTDVLTPDSRLLQLGKNTITSTGINKQNTLLAMKREARVVASGGKCIASTEHGDVVVLVLHFNLQFLYS